MKNMSINQKNQFGQAFAEHWDSLIDWKSRIKTFEFICSILINNKARYVLDVATGTGFDSINLVINGFNVYSMDGSIEMLEVAENNARKNNVKLNLVHSTWGNFSYKDIYNQDIPEKYDAIICLGNSLACEINEENRINAIREWSNLLNNNGILVIDHRNYDNILEKKTNKLKSVYYHGSNVDIIAESVEKDMTSFKYVFEDGSKFNLKMYPITKNKMFEYMESGNFRHEATYGDNLIIDSKINLEEINFYQHVFRKV
jgi:SAM-dependent methyltransferase